MDVASLVCPSCDKPNLADMRFCGYCGSPLTCFSCGRPRHAGMIFCGYCGAAVAAPPATPSSPATQTAPDTAAIPTGAVSGYASAPASSPPPSPLTTSPNPPSEERRLVTALFCDLVGFTPLSASLDPEEVRDLQAAYFAAMAEQIDRYGGTVEKYAGDAVLALFGTPIAHEDDAERAVLCALGMQAAIEPVAETARTRWQADPKIRIGINTGEVVSGTWNASGRQDVAVTGDALNTAARIQTTAEPGEILVGTETMRLTRRRIRYGEQRDVVLKGKLGRVPVFAALGLRERFGERWETGEEATPLVGRDRELVVLLDAWVRAQSGEGQLVTLIGDAGVGKSRLLAEVLDTVATAGAVRVVRARCLSYGQEIALWLIADLLRSLVGIGEMDGLGETREKLTAILPVLLARCDSETQAEALDVIGEVLGLPIGESPVARADAQIRRQALLRSLKVVLGALAERAPTVLVLEDLHWIDTASQEVLTAILPDVPGLRLLVLAAQRPGWTAPWSEWGWTERITIRPFAEPEAIQFAGAVLGTVHLTPALERHVAERAGGNPFFVEELLRALEDTGGLERRDGQVHLVPGVAETVPSTLTEILLARLDRLDGETKGVAQVASVIGRNFAVRLLAAVMAQPASRLESPLAALQQAEIAFPRRGGDLEYVFKHVTVRDVAYHTLLSRRRQELHLQTARAIAALYPSDEYVELIAYHYARTEEHAEAAAWLEKAGDRAASIYAMEAAIENYREARRRQERLGGAPINLARLDEKLGEGLVTVGRNDEAIPLLEGAIETYRGGRDLEGAGRATALLGRALRDSGRSQEGLSRAELMIEHLAWSGPSPALVSLHLARSNAFHALGRYTDMSVAADQAAAIARAIGNERLLASAMERRGTAFTLLGRTNEARPVLEEAIELLERVGDLERLAVAQNNLGAAQGDLGELEEARHFTERALETAERIGNPAHVAFFLMNLAQILLSLGRWEEAREHLERAGTVLATLPSANPTAQYIPAQLGQVLLAQGDWEAAEAALQRALTMAETTGDRPALEAVHVPLAELDILRGEPTAAMARMEPLAGEEGGYRNLIETTLAWALLEAGEITRARELITATVTRAREQGERLALVDALRVQGMVLRREGGDAEAERVLTEGLEIARELPVPYAEAHILEQLGQGDEALAIFQRLGAKKDVDRLDRGSITGIV